MTEAIDAKEKSDEAKAEAMRLAHIAISFYGISLPVSFIEMIKEALLGEKHGV